MIVCELLRRRSVSLAFSLLDTTHTSVLLGICIYKRVFPPVFIAHSCSPHPPCSSSVNSAFTTQNLPPFAHTYNSYPSILLHSIISDFFHPSVSLLDSSLLPVVIMVAAPEVNQFVRPSKEFDAISDAIDNVNILKGQQGGPEADAAAMALKKQIEYDEASKFDADKDKTEFRNYDEACDRVKNFYAEQHRKQTLQYNLDVRAKFNSEVRAKMSVWEAIEMLNTLVDESDPDTEVSQIEHLLQTAEAMRRDGKPDWMQVTGLVHDLGKLLYFFGADGQWDTVGDTFVVGAKFSDKNIYPETCERRFCSSSLLLDEFRPS